MKKIGESSNFKRRFTDFQMLQKITGEKVKAFFQNQSDTHRWRNKLVSLN